VEKLTRYLNPLGIRPGESRRRVEDTPEFAQQHNKAEYDEYDRLYREAWKNMIKAKQAEDTGGMIEWEKKRTEYAKLRGETQFQQVRSKSFDAESERIKQLQTTDLTMDNWNNLPPEAQQEILTAYEDISTAFAASN
jgi:hypothetical protein